MKIGNTPLVKLGERLYAKNESVNPGGSVKDRPIKYILDNMPLKPGDTIVEATSGNTGIALSMFCAQRDLNCKIIMPSNASVERVQIMRAFGAELIEVAAGDFEAAIMLKDTLVKEKGYKTTDQFFNPLNIECHFKELFQEFRQHAFDIGPSPYGSEVSAFVLGTGTGGTIMGMEKGCRYYGMDSKIVAVEPAESPVMSGGEAGLHGIEGIGDGGKYLVDLNKVNEIITISTEDAKERAKWIARDHGIFVGISSGANVLAAERWIENNQNSDETNHNPDGIVFTILCDRGERYFSVMDL